MFGCGRAGVSIVPFKGLFRGAYSSWGLTGFPERFFKGFFKALPAGPSGSDSANFV